MRVTYPSPEPVVTPRAREGLRTVVPTIFPPSTVNRGESVRVRPPELVREHRPPVPQRTGPNGLVYVPKKRGPKPKLRFKEAPTVPSTFDHQKRKGEEDGGYGPHKLAKLGLSRGEERGSEMQMIKLAHRHSEDLKYSHKIRSVPSSSTHQHYGQGRSVHSHRTGSALQGCRTKEFYLSPPHFKHLSKTGQYQPSEVPSREVAFLDDKTPLVRTVGEQNSDLWRPSLSNAEKVLVTDVTTNFLTVTIKESSTDQGFFKSKR